MRPKNSKLIVTLLSITIMLCQGNVAYADETNNTLSQYEVKLQQLNNELGTDYALSPSEGNTYQEMVNFYTSMTIDEFEEYIRDAYETDRNASTVNSISSQNDTSIVASDIYFGPVTQRFYYSPVGYLYITANTVYLDMYSDTRYIDLVSKGHYTGSYPYYDPTSYNSSFSNNMKYLNCNCNCVKYVGYNLIATGTYSFNFTFTAGSGDIPYIV